MPSVHVLPSGERYIKATCQGRSLLVQVSAAENPVQPIGLTYEQIQFIRFVAKNEGCEPWLAKVKLDHFGGLASEVTLTRLD